MAKRGAPTTYDPKYCEEILEYFSIPPYREVMKKVVANGVLIEVPTTEANDFPSFAGFASKIKTHRYTLNKWCDRHPEFSDAYKESKELQENFLLVNGLKNLVSTAFGIFTAKNVLGYRDKQPDEIPNIQVNQPTMSEDQFNKLMSAVKVAKAKV